MYDMKNLMILLLLGCPLFLQAQIDSSLTEWNVTVHIGAYLSSVPRNIEKEMESNGFRKSAGLFNPATSSASMVSKKPVFSVGIERISVEVYKV
jgi:hypothetical protein